MRNINYRNFVKQIDPYVPGKSIEEVKKRYGLEQVIRFASNENPYGPSPEAITAATQSINDMNLYPDATVNELRHELASIHGLKAEEIITANGADNIINILISTYVNEGDEVLYCTPTFPSYRSTTVLMGGVPVEVPLTEQWKYDLDALLNAITHKTKLIFICNPNNPTGTILSADEIESFLKEVPDGIHVVFDEAYIEYVKEANYPTGIDWYKQSYPVITIRTFSKYYGLAGLRVGYAVANENILEPMLRIREPFATNRAAIYASIAALKDTQFYERNYEKVIQGREYLADELDDLGFDVVESHSNFLFVNIHSDALTVFNQLLEKGIIVRPCSPWGYDQHLRISIGTMDQNKQFIQILQKIITS